MLLLLLLASSLSASALFTLRRLDTAKFPLAQCLDGSQGSYYFRPSSAGSTKTKIFYQGGGWCVSDGDCYARSLTSIGTSNGLAPTSPEPAGYCGSAFLSDNATVNPTTADWNAIFVPYCDGSAYTGSRLAPVNFTHDSSQHSYIYYRGAYVRDGLIADWLAQGIIGPTTTDIAIGGCSAGGHAVWLHLDAHAEKMRAGGVPAAARITGLSDAGFFLDHVTEGGSQYRSQLFEWGFGAWNATPALSASCIAVFGWKCIMPQYTARFITTPLFMVNSRYDSCQLGGCELMLPAPIGPWAAMSASSQVAARQYSKDFDTAVAASGFSEMPQHGGFLVSCIVHCNAGDSAWWTSAAAAGAGGANLTMNLAYDAWLNKRAGASWYSDNCDLPTCNPTCA
jgi:hypothetical protein